MKMLLVLVQTALLLAAGVHADEVRVLILVPFVDLLGLPDAI